MKNFLIILAAVVSLSSCKSKNAADTANLPKDISLKPENNVAQNKDREMLSAMIQDIESSISTQTCSDASQWAFAPIGSKPCGGPSSYIAYPKAMEDEILAKIEDFTRAQAAFNTKYQLMSDCRMVMPPSGIQCVDGKAVLTNEISEMGEVQ